MHSVNKMVFGGALLASLMATSFTASATDAQCESAIMATMYNTGGAEFLGRNGERDRYKLLGKLENALLKLSEQKYLDVMAKLSDYQATVISLADAAKPKLNVVDAYGTDEVADGQGGLDGDVTVAMSYCNL